MDIILEQIPDDEPETVVVKYHEKTQDVLGLIEKISVVAEGITAYRGDEIFKIKPNDIFWFEVVENKSFIYCQAEVYETKLKLYEFERITGGMGFFRATKSTVINADKIECVSPSLSGRFKVKFVNGELGVVSRMYVSALKKVFGL